MPNQQIKLLLLGTVRIETNGQMVDQFRSHRAVALLVYLASQLHAVPRSELVALIWPDKTEERGRANLRWALTYLGKLLPDCWQVTRQTAQFVPDGACWVDALVLKTALAGDEIGLLETAVSRIEGPFCRGFYFDESPEYETWLLTQREHWRQQVQIAYQQLINHYSGQQAYDRALQFARHLLAQDEWQESAHRQVMLLLARTGDFSGALAQYETCRQILAEELQIEPTQQTQDLAARIDAIRERPRHNLPPQPTQFISRESELVDLAALLNDPNNRLVTIIAPGGMGKTRLALAVAAEQTRAFLDGVAFVSLAPIDSVDQLAPAIVQTLSDAGFIDPQKGHKTAVNFLLDALADKELLLLLDNYEQLLPDIDLLLAILQRAPGVKLLVTSRQRLNTRWERPFLVEGLPHNELDDAALQLFRQTAVRVHPPFSPNDADNKAILRICQMVEGMPLAIELAANWVRLLPPQTIADEIAQNLAILQTQQHDLPARQRSMHAVFDQTWVRLSAAEQKALAQLSVFRGAFTLEAAQQVADADWQIMASLVDKSLLGQQTGGNAVRYVMHELLRQYATEQLATHFDTAKARYRHGTYYAQLAFAFEPRLTEDPPATLVVMRQEIDNIRAAWEWALSTHQGDALNQMLHSIYLFYWLPSLVRDGLAVMSAAVAQLTAVHQMNETLQLAYGRILTRQGGFTWLLHEDYESAENLLNQAIAILKHRQPATEYALALNFLANTIYVTDIARGRTYWQQSLVIFQEAGNLEREASLLRNLCVTAPTYSETLFYWEQSIALKDVRNESHLYFIRADRDMEAGYPEKAEAFARKSVEMIRTLDDPPHLILALNVLNKILIAQNKLDEARAHLQEMQEVADKMDIAWHSALVQLASGLLAMAEKRWEEAERIFEQVKQDTPTEGSFNWLQRRARFYLGDLALQQKQYELARTHWESCEEWVEAPGFLAKCDQWRNLLRIGETWLCEGDGETAVSYLNQAKEIAYQIGVEKAWQTEHDRLHRTYENVIRDA